MTKEKVRTSEQTKHEVRENLPNSISVKKKLIPSRRVTLKLYKKTITEELTKSRNASLLIANTLYKVKEENLYIEDNCINIYEFAEKNFKIARGTCSNLINICKRFEELGENGMWTLLPQYEGFNCSQLMAMVSIKDKNLLEEIKPSMTVREIKEAWQRVKKASKQPKPAPSEITTEVAIPGSKIMNSEKLPYSTLNGEYLVAEADDEHEINSKLRMELLDKLTDFKNVNPGIPVHIHISMVWDVPASHMEVQEGKQPETK